MSEPARKRPGPGGFAHSRADRREARVDERDAVLDALRQRIASQKLAPGTRISEQAVCDEFGISRAQVRDVFGDLAQRGLIDRVPNRGAFVARIDPDLAFELFDVREVLEGLCVRVATERAPPETWQPFLDALDDTMMDRVKKGEIEPYIQVVDSLRAKTIEVAGNELAETLLADIRDRTFVLIRRMLVLPGRAEQGVIENRLFLAAMRRGDAVEAERLKRANVRSARAWVERYRTFIF